MTQFKGRKHLKTIFWPGTKAELEEATGIKYEFARAYSGEKTYHEHFINPIFTEKADSLDLEGLTRWRVELVERRRAGIDAFVHFSTTYQNLGEDSGFTVYECFVSGIPLKQVKPKSAKAKK